VSGLLKKAVGLASLGALLVAMAARPSAAEGVHVALLPTGQTVTPGSTFVLELRVTEAGSLFNGFDALVTYDPAALTFVPTSPTSLQQGSYMVGACSSRFHRFSASSDSLSFTDVLLCQGVALSGPGQIYTLRFTATTTPQVTHVRLQGVQFYDGGLFVNPAYTTDATLGIGVTVDVAPAPLSPPAGPVLRASPNPFRGTVSISIARPVDGTGRIVIRDIQGRQVRRFECGRLAAGSRQVQWDGRDDAGRALPAGVYRITLQSEHGIAGTLATLLR
jgi:hypothetical protein